MLGTLGFETALESILQNPSNVCRCYAPSLGEIHCEKERSLLSFANVQVIGFLNPVSILMSRLTTLTELVALLYLG